MSTVQTTLYKALPPRPAFFGGLDYGTAGAFSLVDDGLSLVMVASWGPAQRKRVKGTRLRVYTVADGEQPEAFSTDLSNPMVLGEAVAIAAMNAITHSQNTNIDLSVEGVYLDKNPQTGIRLGHRSGRMVGVMGFMMGDDDPTITQPVQWRSALGMKRMKRKEAKAAALRYIPYRVQGLQSALDVLGAADHIAESAGIALWGRASWNDRAMAAK